MSTVSIENAQSHLRELIERLQPGETLVITQDDKPVARLVAEKQPALWPCKAGSARSVILDIAPDFDAPLDEFREYME